MQTDFFNDITKMGQRSYATLQELSTINAQALKALTDLHLDFASFNLESSATFGKRVSQIQNYTDLLNTEANFVNEYGSKFVEWGQKTTNILTASRDQTLAWYENMLTADKKKTPSSARRSHQKTSKR